MGLNFVAFILGYILVIASIVSIPLKRQKVLKSAGNCIYSFSKSKPALIVAVDFIALVLISLVMFMNYSPFVSIVLCGCSVLGSWIITGEAALGPKYGLYDNGIIALGKYIPYDDIVTFPVFNLPKNEQKNHPGNVLVIATKKYGNLEIAFDTDSTCSEVVAKLREMKIVK